MSVFSIILRERRSSISEKRILELLKNQKADVICLQEIYIMGDPGFKELEIKSALGGKYYSHFKVIGTGKNSYYGIATLSRFPITGRGILYMKNHRAFQYTPIFLPGRIQ